MDIEEYLRQKRELEAKKEMLEAKEKVVDHEKERFKKEQRAKLYAEHGVTPKHPASAEVHEHTSPHYHAPSSGPGMWNTILLFLILILLAVTYFIPRFGEEQIRDIISDETGSKPVEPAQNQNQATTPSTTTNQNNEPTPSEDEEEPPEGPLFSLSVRDDEEGLFDEDGKIDGEVIILDIQSGPKYYEDFTLQFVNKEAESIMCKIDREIEIDTDFDGRIDIEDADVNRFKIEIDPKATKTINSDVVPGLVETGTYEGKGDIRATYEARCYYCLDEDCNKVDDEAESVREAFFRVWINKEGLLTNTTNSTT